MDAPFFQSGWILIEISSIQNSLWTIPLKDPKETIDSEFHSGFEFWTLHCSDMNPRTLRNPSGFIVNWAPWISRFNFSILWIRFIIALLNIYLTRDGRPFFSLIGIRWVWKNIGSQMSFLQCLRRLGSRTGKRICNSASSDWTRNTNSV